MADAKTIYDVVIIGAGCAGLTAAIYAARYGMKTIVLSEDIGGTMNEAYPVENYPGFKSISGFELMQKFREQVESLNVKIETDEATAIKKNSLFTVLAKGKNYKAKSVIFATGSKRRKLDVPGEVRLRNRGVSYCAICDAPLFREKTVAVVGGSDSAAQAALLLAEQSKKVYIIYRKAELRAEPINVKRVKDNKKIEIIYSANVTEALGKERLEAVKLDAKHKGSDILALDGIFVEIGSEPSAELAKNVGVKLNDKNEIVVNPVCETSVPGIFAAGDITDVKLKQAVVACGQGALAALSAYRYAKSQTK